MNYVKEFIIRRFPFVLVFLLVLIAVLFGFSFKGDVSYKNPGLIAESQVGVWIARVGMLAILPQDEIPDVATVSSPEILKNQAFFTEAKRGDIVLIYSKAKKAVLYDPNLNKIITMATVNIGNAVGSKDLLPASSKTQQKSISTNEENQF